jgi:hypothetical protein
MDVSVTPWQKDIATSITAECLGMAMLMILEAEKLKTETLLKDSIKSMRSASLDAGYGRQAQGQTAKELHIQGIGQTTGNQLVLTGSRLN